MTKPTLFNRAKLQVETLEDRMMPSASAYLFLDGPTGESTGKPATIEIISFQFGVNNGNTGTYPSNPHPPSTPPSSASQPHFNEVVIHKTPNTSGDYLKITLNDALISHFSSSSQSNDPPSESISFDFTTIEFFPAPGQTGKPPSTK